MSVKRTQQQRTEATRGALIAAARRLFAERGYADTGTGRVVSEAGVTRGALYHHFTDKSDLFRAVYEAVEAELVERVALAAADHHRAIDRLRAGAAAFLDACLDPEVHQITLVDAPAVLGWDEWKRLDAVYGYGLVRTALEHAIEVGAIRPQPVEALAHVVLGALTEGALHVARSPDPETARRDVGATIDALLEGLRADPADARGG